MAQTDQNPEGHRYAVDCAWTDAPADVLAPLLLDIWRGLDTEHSFSIWYGWAPDRAAARHGVLGRGQRLRRDVPHLHRRGRRRALPRRRCTSGRRRSRATAAWASTSATPTSPGAPDRFLSDEHFDRLEEIRAAGTRDRLFASYLVSRPGEAERPWLTAPARLDHVGLNVADLAAAEAWYAAAFGYEREFVARLDALDLDIVMLIHPGPRRPARAAPPARLAAQGCAPRTRRRRC